MNTSITRRIIAIIFSTTGAGVMTYLSVIGVAEAFTALIATVAVIVGYYFGVQSVNSNTK